MSNKNELLEKNENTQMTNSLPSNEKSENTKNELQEKTFTAKTDDNQTTKNVSKELNEKIDSSEQISDKIEETKKFTFAPIPKKSNDVLSVFTLLVVLFFTIVLLIFVGFTIYNVFNPNIISGVSIKGVDVSHLSPSDAKYQLDNYLSNKLPEEIKVTHNDFETTISLAQMGIRFDTKAATNSAFSIARNGNAFENNWVVLRTMFDKVNID